MVAKAAKVSRSTVARALNNDPNARMSASTRRHVREVALALQYDSSSLRTINRRRSPRLEIAVGARVSIVMLTSNRVASEGQTVITTVNRTGMQLSQVTFPGGSFPTSAFQLRVSVDEVGPMKGFDAWCSIVNLAFRPGLTFGVEIVAFDSELAKASFNRLLTRLEKELKSRK